MPHCNPESEGASSWARRSGEGEVATIGSSDTSLRCKQIAAICQFPWEKRTTAKPRIRPVIRAGSHFESRSNMAVMILLWNSRDG
jgi:hypothetical protein